MPTLAAVLNFLDAFAPPRLAAEWDNVGLLLGRREGDAVRLMTCLTLTPDCAAEAIAAKANLIVTHHPILFKATKQLTEDSAEGRMLLDLVQAGIAVYSPHTSFDNTRGGINDHLAELLGLASVAALRTSFIGAKQVKLVVFAPESDLEHVSSALFAAGAGRIGEYKECSFRLAGTGTFHGSDVSNPTIGQKGRREEVSEWRLEVVCPEGKLGHIVQAMRAAHSYEEPAFDLYPLSAAPGLGEGRIGTLAAPLPLGELASQVRTLLQCGPVGVVGDPARVVARVAIACGAAGEFLGDAARAGADVFLTGEMRYHDCLMAQTRGVAALLPGHHASERPGVEMLARKLAATFPDVEAWAARCERDPLSWV